MQEQKNKAMSPLCVALITIINPHIHKGGIAIAKREGKYKGRKKECIISAHIFSITGKKYIVMEKNVDIQPINML